MHRASLACSSDPVFLSPSSPRLPLSLPLQHQLPRSLPASLGVQLLSTSPQIYRRAVSLLHSSGNPTYLNLRISFLEFRFTDDHKAYLLLFFFFFKKNPNYAALCCSEIVVQNILHLLK